MIDLKEYEKLMNNILSLYSGESGKSFMITSSVSREGCSTVASNLASIFAKNGSLKILLIDCNLRNPSLHRYFELENDKGLSDLLLGRANIDDVIKETKLQNLSVITVGNGKGGQTEFLENAKLEEKLGSIKEKADYLIFDSPPVNAYPGTHVLSSQMDGVILVVQAGRIRWEIAQKTKEQLELAHANILGVVLNRKKYVIPEFLYSRL